MNVFDFINSKAIADYLQKIEYQFSSDEVAFLIYQSERALEQKIAAWREVIETLPDHKYLWRRNRRNKKVWCLHEFLQTYTALLEKLINKAISAEDNAIFTFSSYYSGEDEWHDDVGLYRTVDDCLKVERCRDIPNLKFMRVRKRYIDNPSLYFDTILNENGKVIDIEPSNLDDADDDIFYYFDHMWYGFPTPFKRGDIVTSKYGPFGRGLKRIPCVLDYLCTWDSVNFRRNGFSNEESSHADRRVHRLIVGGDRSDMIAYGYFVNDDGSVFFECMHDYLSLEYYAGELQGPQRTLKAISNYHKHKIGMDLLLRAYSHIMAEEYTIQDRKCLGDFNSCGLRLAGVLNDGENADEEDSGELFEVIGDDILLVHKKTLNLFVRGSTFGPQHDDIIVEDGNEAYCVKNHCLCSKNGEDLLLLSLKSTIPQDIRVLGENLFAWADEAVYPLIPDALQEGLEIIKFRALSIRTNYPQKFVISASVKKVEIMALAVYSPFATFEFLGDPIVELGVFGTKKEAEILERTTTFKNKNSREMIAFGNLPDSKYINPNHIMVVAKPNTKVAAYCENYGIPLTRKADN